MTQNQPVALNVAIGGVLTTGVALTALLVPDLTVELQIATVAFGNALILLGVVVLTQRQVTPIHNATLAAGTPVKVQGTEDTVIVEATPPGPVGIEGDIGSVAPGDGPERDA